jgi:glutathione S-transferase
MFRYYPQWREGFAGEEWRIPNEPHLLPIGDDGSRTAEFQGLSPNGKIPAIIDRDGPNGEPVGMFEPGVILPTSPTTTDAALGGDSVAVLPDGQHRADVRQLAYLHHSAGKA